MTTDPALEKRRLREMKHRGLKFVGARRDIRLFSVACWFGITHRDYVQGIVFDRGENKDHGSGKRIEGPWNYTGQPVYWLRKDTSDIVEVYPKKQEAQR